MNVAATQESVSQSDATRACNAIKIYDAATVATQKSSSLAALTTFNVLIESRAMNNDSCFTLSQNDAATKLAVISQ